MPRFFERGDPAEREQRDLEAKLKGKIDQRVDNAVRLQTAEAKLAEARSNVEALALEADEAALDRALQAKRGAEDKLAALRGAALKIGKEISEIEMAIDKVVDGRVRGETGAACNVMADRVQKAAAAFDEAARELEEASREAGIIIPEGNAVFQFTRSMREQIPPATTLIVGALKQHARGVLNGHYPASLRRPAAPPVQLKVVPSEPMVTLFVTKNIRYVGQGGDIICCGRNRRHDLPVRIGELALAAGAAVPLSDRKRIETFEGTSGMFVPTPQACEWIGPEGKEPAPLQMRPGGAPVHHSMTEFTVMDRGKSYVAMFSRPPEPEGLPLAASARKMPDGE